MKYVIVSLQFIKNNDEHTYFLMVNLLYIFRVIRKDTTKQCKEMIRN